MPDVFEKLSLIIGEILLYSTKVHSVSKPNFTENAALIAITDINNITKDIFIPYTKLLKVHDHLLSAYIFELMKENNLL